MYKAARFQASSLQAMANGQVLMPYLTVLSGSKLEHLISTYKLNDLDPQAFYPQQIVCDMQKRMSEDMGLFSGELVNIGISFPPRLRRSKMHWGCCTRSIMRFTAIFQRRRAGSSAQCRTTSCTSISIRRMSRSRPTAISMASRTASTRVTKK